MDFLDQCKEFDSKYDDDLAKINMFRTQHVAATNALYDFDVRAAKDVLNNAKKELKEEFRREIMEELRELGTSIKADSMSRRVSQRNLRSKAKAQDEKEENKSKENVRGLSPCVTNFRRSFCLTEDEMEGDLKQIADNWHKAAVDFRKTQSFVPVKVEGGRMQYDDLHFERGDYVLIQSELTKMQERGHLVAVRKKEIHVKTRTGKKWQIQVEHLRNGRVFLFPGNVI